MDLKHPNLNYEFYFLFQTKYESWQEPSFFSNQLIQNNLHSIRIDQDKRLFRYASPANENGQLPPLEEWEQHLQQGWKQIQICYQNRFKPQAFMGVTLLIMDDSVTVHQIQCNTSTGATIFKPTTEKVPDEKILLKVTDKLGTIRTPVTLEEFEPNNYSINEKSNWQIQLSSSQTPCLIPMQVGENYPNPIFAVYGLAHSILPDEVAEQLQIFLCSDKVALIWRIFARLMMQKWQFQRLDIAAYQLRQQLDSKTDYYQQIPDSDFECANNKKLAADLRKMAKIDAKAKQVLARLDAGVKTLEINSYNLDRYLHRSEQIWQYLDDTDKKYQWNLTWQNDTESPLLDNFDLNIRQLQNHSTYIQAALTYLDGIRTRWHVYLEGQRLQYESNIQLMLFVLTFIASFTGVVAFITQNPGDVAFLLGIFTDNPQKITQIGHLLLIGINILILIFFILPFCYLYLKSLWKKFRCLF
ncbi:MAG: hypothetical protein KAH84_06630 [Thiomargarita sp.]|nr:hypothetical protein [Thiomargarita sp.]